LVSTNKIFNARTITNHSPVTPSALKPLRDERSESVDADGGMPGAMSSQLPATGRTNCSQNGGRPAAVGAHIVEIVRQR
jgi:hypothetical protein